MATQKSESALVNKVWNIANVLSSAGVSFYGLYYAAYIYSVS